MFRAMVGAPVAPAADTSVARFGLTEVYATTLPAQVDLVFVHGLNGDPKKTWTSKASQVFWPQDLLPGYIQDQRARVLVYGYDADVAALGSTGVSKDKIYNHAERLVSDLCANRRIRKATERPIIFIAHSLGGLIVKRALISSSEISGSKTEHLRSVYVSTYGILFLGTPHKGADLAKWGTYLSLLCRAVLPSKLASTESQLVETLRSNSETLSNIDRQFTQLMDDFHLFFFHEAKPTDLKGTLHYIVEEESAAPTLPDVERAGIQADHSHMCKFESIASPGFDLVIDGIQRYSDEAPDTIRNRWVMEREERLMVAKRKAKENFPIIIEMLGGPDQSAAGGSRIHSTGDSVSDLEPRSLSASTVSTSKDTCQKTQKASGPFFIVPPGFRANSFFVGMEREMHELDSKLSDARRRSGTACVLLHGQPGVGKSHVARQYVYKNRWKFPGGVFWISAHLIDEIYKDYWQIYQKVVTKVAPGYTHRSAEDLGRNFVDDVRDWFADREQWLLVFDGVSADHEKEIDALQKFIPDSANCGIIYVSRSRRLENMQRLLRPRAIKITGLKESDALNLLFKEMNNPNPREAQIMAAKVLIKKIGGLPLAISAIARRLSDTHEPIEKYSLRSYADDPKLGGTYQHIVADLQRNSHSEAINLMNIVCFLGPHIPVELVHLGLKSLRPAGVEVRASEEGGRRDLNTTLGILMRHALIERNEPDDDESLSNSHDSMVEPEPIDMLNLHAVIQKYWRDSLNDAKQLPQWLGLTIRLLTHSFQEANHRINRQGMPARVSDYRWFMVHGRKLRNHCMDYHSRHQRLEDLSDELDGTIELIEDEIKAREPSSSQESLSQVEFQTSIFDRTNTSSSSEPSQSSLEGEITDLMELDPHAENVSPDGRYLLYAPPMLKDLSGSTLRPGSSGGATRAATTSPRPSNTKPLPPQRSDSFRSTSAGPMVYPGHAMGLVSAGTTPVGHSRSAMSERPGHSKALSSLAELNSRGRTSSLTYTPSRLSPRPSINANRSPHQISPRNASLQVAPFYDAGETPLSRYHNSKTRQPVTPVAFQTSGLPPVSVLPGTFGYPPYSDPLPSIAANPGLATGPNSRRTSGPGVGVDGLGIANDLQHKDEILAHLFPSERDANLNSQAFHLNQNLPDGSKAFQPILADPSDTNIFIPAVRFAAPNFMSTQFHSQHQRSNSDTGANDLTQLQVHEMQRHQAQQGEVSGMAPGFASLENGGVPLGLVHSAILPSANVYRATSGNSVPFLPADNAQTVQGNWHGSQRRRTLSAPESPGWGDSTAKKLWGE